MTRFVTNYIDTLIFGSIIFFLIIYFHLIIDLTFMRNRNSFIFVLMLILIFKKISFFISILNGTHFSN